MCKLLILTLCAMSLMLSGCAVRQLNECSVFWPIYLDPEDVRVISDPLVRQLVTHNRTGEAVCGW